MKFRRHDLEKRSGGSPVIVFHHRRPVCFSSPAPAPPPPLFPPFAVSPPSYVVRISGVEPTREHQFFSAPSDVCASFPLRLLLHLLFRDPSRPWDFLGHGSVIWCPTDDRSLTLPLPLSTLRRSPGSSIMALSAPFGLAHAESGYPSFLRAHHLPHGADRKVETSRRFS